MIPLLDLPAQHAPIQAELDAALRRVLAEGAFIQGPDVAAFAADLGAYLGGAHVVPCANGTDALTLAFLALGLRPGDEVVVPAFTYVATAEAAALLGLRVVLADVRPDTFGLDAAAFEATITDRTRAVVPVHLFGQCADMAGILAVARRHNLFVIEDTAQALGAELQPHPSTGEGERFELSLGVRPDAAQKSWPGAEGSLIGAHLSEGAAGTLGTVGTTSFFPSKNLGAMGDGGALLTRDAGLAERLYEVANHGQPRGVKYRHERVGLNSRLDTLQAALLRVKLRYLDGWTARRQELAARYDAALADVPGVRAPHRDLRSTHVFHQYVVTLADEAARENLRAYLAARQIAAAVYYPLPLHRQPVYAHLGREGQFPVSEELCRTVLALPIHPTLTDAQADEVMDAVRDWARRG